MFKSLKCYSDWCSGTIQNALTPLTLLNREDSAKQLVNCLQLTVISGIGLLEEGNVSYVLPAHSEMLILPMEYLLERKEQWTMELINNDLLVLLKLRNLNDKNVLWVWGIVWGMKINTIVVGCYITHLILILLINIGGGGRIWTFDLRVMSPTSYLTAPPRYWKWKMKVSVLERETGFEPATLSLEGWCSTDWATLAFQIAYFSTWYKILSI